jgi:shikimate dehydrogenase
MCIRDRYLEIDQHQNNDPLQSAHALILGAGGAARAVAYSLLGVGWDVSIAARKLERARSLAGDLRIHFKNKKIKAVELSYSGLAKIGQRYSLIVNATAAGMYPDVLSSPWPAGLNFPEISFVYDLIYNPGMTELLKQAREKNIPASGGIGMLIEQAALSFQIWTGLSISRDVMYDSIKDIT